MRLFRSSPWVALCVALLLQACSNQPTAPPPVVDYDREYDFSQVRSIAIQPIARDTVATMLITDRQIKRINGICSYLLNQLKTRPKCWGGIRMF